MPKLPTKSRRFVALLIVLTVSCFAPANALARTLYVARDGSGEYSTIHEAVLDCQEGDVILLGPGRYTELAPPGYADVIAPSHVVIDEPGITLRGVDRSTVIIGPDTEEYGGPNGHRGITTGFRGKNLKVENLTVENISRGVEVFGVGSVSDCDFRNCYYGVGVYLGGLLGLSTYDVSGSEFVDCIRGVTADLDGSPILVEDCRFEGSSQFPGMSPRYAESSDLMIRGGTAAVLGCSFVGDASLLWDDQNEGSVEDCVFDRGSVVIVDSSVHLQGNRLGHSLFRSLSLEGAGPVTGNDNLFGGADDVTLYLDAESVELHANHIVNAAEFSVKVANYTSPTPTVDLTGNWWGSMDPEEIAAWILDAHDDPALQVEVQYLPFLSQPIAAEGASIGEFKVRYGRR